MKTAADLVQELKGIPGGYEYIGVCSMQYCFPLKSGGELRFILVDEDVDPEGKGEWQVDLYDGALPPGITGPVNRTGKKAGG